MERHISIHIDQTDSNTVRLHYDYGSGDQAPPVAVDATAIQRWIDRAETDYYAELPANPEDRDQHLRSLVAFGRDLYAFLDTPQRLLSRCSESSARNWNVLVLGISVGHSTARFGHLPWELLHDGDTFVVTASTPIVPIRRLRGASVRRPPAHRPLRLVFMACAPDLNTAAPLDYDAEQGRIWEKTRRQQIDLEVEELGDLDELEERIHRRAAGEIDAVHLTGHALHTDDGPKFLTEDPMGRPRQTGFRDLHRSLAGRSTVVFLSGCRTGEAADAGAVASLAEELAQATAPVVLGWGRPVADVMATEAAAVFYQWLARGESPTTALAHTYRDMHTTVPYWHLLRMFVRGEPPGPLVVPAADRPVGAMPRDAIVVGEPHLGKAEPAYPDPLRFVGRRRQVQRSIRVLHPFTDVRAARPGLVVQGMGGIGKTTLMGRVCQRLEDQFHIVILRLRENYLTEEYLRRVLMADPQFERVLDGVDTGLPLARWLGAAFRHYQGNLLFWLDEFETSFRPDHTAVDDIAMVDEIPIAQSEAVQVLEVLAAVLGAPPRSDRIVITSRYPLRLPCTARFETITLTPPREEEIHRLIHRLRTDDPTELTPEQIAAIREAAGDNPRLLITQFEAARSGMHLNGDLLRVRLRDTRDRMLDADILLPTLVDKVTEESRRLLEVATPFDTPVPAGALARLMDEPTAHVMERADKLAGLNLLERSWQDGVPRFVVPIIVRARFTGQGTVADPAARCAAALAAELGTFLDEPDVRRLDQPLLHELRRLALDGGKPGLAVDATVALADIHGTFARYGEVAKLCHQMLSRTSEHRLYRTLAEAESELGHSHDAIRHFEHALTQCPPKTDRDRADTLVSAAKHFTFNLMMTPHPQRVAQLTEAIDIARRHGGLPGTLSVGLRTLARVLAMSDDPAERERVPALLDEAMDVARTVSDAGAEANCVRFDRVCALLLDRGDFSAAEGELEAIVKVFEGLQQPRNAAVTLLEAASNWLNLDEVEQAQTLIEKVDALNRYLSSPRTEVELELLKGDVGFHQGDYAAAEEHYEIGFESASRIGYEQFELAGLRGRLMCRKRLGDPEGAARLLREVLRRDQEFRSPTYRVDLLLATVDQADLDSDEQRHEILERAREAASIARTNDMAGRELQAWESWCDTADELGVAAAEREAALRRILDLQKHTKEGERTDTFIRLGRLLLSSERFMEARSPLAEALAAHTGDEQGEAELRGLLAEAARGSGALPAAVEQLTAVARIRIGLGHHDTAARTLHELASVHLAALAPDIAYERLHDARSLARRVPSAELEHQILEELATVADSLGRFGEAHRWQVATESANLRRVPLRVVVAEDLIPFFDQRQGGVAIEETERIRDRIRMEDGWDMPGIRYSTQVDLPPRRYVIYVWGDAIHQGLLPTDHALVPARPPEARIGSVTTEHGIPAVEWLTEEQAAGLSTLDPAQVAVSNLRVAVADHRGRLETYEEPAPPPEPHITDFTVEQILDRLGQQDPLDP